MYITGNTKFEDYLNKYVILEVNGRKKKFFVQEKDSTVYYPPSAYIFSNNYNIIGLATSQNCETCDDILYITGISYAPAQGVELGASIDLTVSMAGATSLAYFWYFNSVLLDNNFSTLSISDFSEEDVGTYYVEVSGACNIATSDTVALFIEYPVVTTTPGMSTTTPPPPTTTPPPPTTVPPTTIPPTTTVPPTTTPIPTPPPTTIPPTTTAIPSTSPPTTPAPALIPTTQPP